MNAESNKPDLLEMTRPDLEALLAEWGEPKFRARQIHRQLYTRHILEAQRMTDLPAALRERLERDTLAGSLRLEKVQIGDGGLTRKALFRLPGGEPVESVLMIYPDRATVCVSSQSGCPMACVFCATGKLGFLCDLTPGQIFQQVLWAAATIEYIADQPEREAPGTARVPRPDPLPSALTHVVFMGMGEAFNNYDNWWTAVERINDPAGFNLGARHLTVSTVGLIPGIRRLAKEKKQLNLAVSLHAARDDLRTELMPVNKAYPIYPILEAVREYLERTGRRVSFEYILMQDINDQPEEAERLAKLLRNGPLGDVPQMIHVNLIPWNPVPGTPLARSHRNRIRVFQNILRERGIPCTVRAERGQDIDAACGQLG